MRIKAQFFSKRHLKIGSGLPEVNSTLKHTKNNVLNFESEPFILRFCLIELKDKNCLCSTLPAAFAISACSKKTKSVLNFCFESVLIYI